MEDWRRDDALDVGRGGHVDFGDVLPGTNNDNGSPQAMNVYSHQPTARLPRPMYLPHPSSSHGSFRYPSVIEPVPRYSTNAVPSLDLSGPTLSASTADTGIPKIPPPNDESEAYPSMPIDGWRLPVNQKGRVSPLVLQEVEQQPLGKTAICRGSPTVSPRDRDLTDQRRPELTEPARSQTSLLPIRDASLIHGNLLRRQTLRLRKTCDACGKHKKACDGKRPCYRCVRRRTECVFGLRKRTGPKRPKDSKESGELGDAKAYLDGRNGSGGAMPAMPAMEMLARGASSSSASEDVVDGRGGTTFVPSVEDNLATSSSSSQNLGNDKRSNPRGFRSNDSNPSAEERAAWPSATVFPPPILGTNHPNSGERDLAGAAAHRDSSEQHGNSPEISTSDVRPIYGSGGGGSSSSNNNISNSRDTNSSMTGGGGSLPRLLDGEGELWTAPTYCAKPLPRSTHPSVEITPSSSSSSSSSSSRWPHPAPTTSSWVEPWHGCGPLHESNLSPTIPPGGRSSAHNPMEEWHQYQHQHQHQPFPLPAGVEAERARARARGISRHSLESSPTVAPSLAVATSAAAAAAAAAAGDNEGGQEGEEEEEEQAMLEHRSSRWSPTRHQRLGELGEMRANGGVGSSEQQGYGFLRFPS